MTDTNPYQAPNANVDQVSEDLTYQPKIFTAKGRIGRLRYLAYTLAMYLLLIPAGILIGIISAIFGIDSGVSQTFMIICAALVYITLIVFYFILLKRRFNDMGHSGWMSLLFLVPIANLVVTIWVLVGRGNAGANAYGPAPVKNTKGVVLAACVFPAIMIIGILAAISIPAYQDYIDRSTITPLEIAE